ncbi:MAG: T9SS type A sorting domain-containing protein [Bacteroidales bacterium]|nr:T9SS type A sorting domain-containing protein [Bacteroidales bacterium]
MKKLFSLISFVLLFTAVSAQVVSVTLTFTGRDANNQYVPLNRVVITNYSQGWQETLTWPDTVLMMTTTGIQDYVQGEGIALSQNNPNPFDGTTFVNLTIAEPGEVMMEISDISGRIVETQSFASLQAGNNQLRISLSNSGVYFLTARQNGHAVSVKMVNRGSGGGNAISFSGNMGTQGITTVSHNLKHTPKGSTDKPFNTGDHMDYVGYATINGHEVTSAHIDKEQYSTETFVLAFAEAQGNPDGHPCPGTPTVTDIDGNTYNTVMIGTQCWMRENMRVTRYANGDSITASVAAESYVDPYYYDYNNPDIPLEKRGYLYNWPAAMHGLDTSSSVPSGIQGICPTGWHVPSWDEWDALRTYLGSMDDYHCGGCVECIAPALCDTIAWSIDSLHNCVPGQNLSANNATGFSAIPAGYFWSSLAGLGNQTAFWSTTLSPGADMSGPRYALLIRNYVSNAAYATYFKNYGLSVRCLRD